MTNDIDIMKKALAEYDKAVRLKKLNQELFDHLLGSVIWIIQYSKKYGVPIPHRQEMFRMIQKSDCLVDEILDNFSPKNKHPFKTPEDSTEPNIMINLRRLYNLLAQVTISSSTNRKYIIIKIESQSNYGNLLVFIVFLLFGLSLFFCCYCCCL